MSEQSPLLADPIRSFILDQLRDVDSRAPQEIARAYGLARQKPSDPPEAWRRYLVSVRQQALSLARNGAVVFLRKGKPVDPRTIKGVVRLRLPRPGEVLPYDLASAPLSAPADLDAALDGDGWDDLSD